jgi:accessory gene regulator protein AgrB
MDWKSIVQTVFYIVGIIFFIVVIVAAFMFMRRTAQTANVIKRVLTSSDVEDLIMKVKDGVMPLVAALGRK